jgi:hypothetical protein
MVSMDDRVRLESASVASSMTSSAATVVVTQSSHNLLVTIS